MNMFTSGYWEYEYVYQDNWNMNIFTRNVEYVYLRILGIWLCLPQDIGNMNMILFSSGYWEYEYVYQDSWNMNIFTRKVKIGIRLSQNQTKAYGFLQQDCHNALSNFSKTHYYVQFISRLNVVHYSTFDIPIYPRKAFTKFRCWDHKLNSQ